jgi:hypothetical protein
MKRSAIGCVVVLVITWISIGGAPLHAQTKTRSDGAKPTADKYKEAREHIKSATTLLSDFIAENPKSGDAYFAKMQLAALRNIFKTDIPVLPVAFRETLTWRVVGVTSRESDTKITFEVENSSDSAAAKFPEFNSFPLVMVANKKVYSMKKGSVRLPAGAKAIEDTWHGWNSWELQPSQAVTVEVYFDALDEGATEGLIKYVDSKDEQPARFSMMNVTQGAR